MLKLLSISLIGVFLQFWVTKPQTLEPLELLLWENAPIFKLPNEPDPKIQHLTNEYLQTLKNKGFSTDQQGIWLQSDWIDFADHKGKNPISAASLTKIVTTIASLKKWGLNHHFETLIYHNGIIENNVLKGDLIIQGGGNPFYVWEEAIAVGNMLNKLGISEIKGNLLIFDNFTMNFQKNPQKSGEFFRQGINKNLWTKEITKLYEVLPPKTPRPYVKITGNIKVIKTLPINSQLLLTHQSLSLREIIRQMNIHSSNYIAQRLADQIGTPAQITQIAVEFAKINPTEIKLINGSGLGGENKISPEAVCDMMLELDHHLESNNLEIEDLFPVSGKDKTGTIENRKIPSGISFKTGTLPSIAVSSLAGIIPTKNYGHVCFAILNNGISIFDARKQQDEMLNKLAHHWQIIPYSAKDHPQNPEKLGDPNRIIIEN